MLTFELTEYNLNIVLTFNTQSEEITWKLRKKL